MKLPGVEVFNRVWGGDTLRREHLQIARSFSPMLRHRVYAVSGSVALIGTVSSSCWNTGELPWGIRPDRTKEADMSETSREAISLLQAVQTEQVGKASALSRSALSHSGIWQAIDTLAEKHKLSASGLARRAGLDPTSFNKSKRLGPDGRERWPSTESISKVLEATGASLDEFLGYLAPTGTPRMPDGVFLPQMSSIPLLGFAQAGAGGFFDDGGFPAGQGWDVVEFPAAVSKHNNVYALEVQGDSMLPLYRDGDRLIVEPGAQVRKGDRVVVKTREGEVMAKVLARQSARSIELSSLNPDHPNRNFAVEDIDWIARIIWASQ